MAPIAEDSVPPDPTAPTLSGTLELAARLVGVHLGPLALLCTAAVGFDAALTYFGGAITFGYGEPVFALVSVVLQEVIYFGPAVLLWNELTRAREAAADGSDTLLTRSTVGTLLSGFNSRRAWLVALQVTSLYMFAFSVLLCAGTVVGGFVLYFIPGGFLVAVKVLRSLVGPIMGAGYLATALAVARPHAGVSSATSGSFLTMARHPVLAGLVLGVGGLLEQAAGMTLVLGIALDMFLLCYAAALVRQLLDAGELGGAREDAARR